MTHTADRMKSLLVLYRDRLLPAKAKQAWNPATDPNGVETNLYATGLRFVGVAQYKVEGNVDAFKDSLCKAAALRLELFRRRSKGDPISESYISMLAYKSLLDALASGAFSVARELAFEMGGRPEIEHEHDHPFDHAMGYALKWAVIHDESQMRRAIAQLADETDKGDNCNFRGYSIVLQAILEHDLPAANAGLCEINRGHQEECRSGVFKDKEDEVLCVWGIGLANLCRHYGLSVQDYPPMLPGELFK